MSYPTEAEFLESVKDHRIIYVKVDGVYRNIRFKKPGTSNQYFDLVTWPGHLCFTGDMGTYVFERTDDMFQFFRDPKGSLKINPTYWGEKMRAVCSTGGHKKFSAEAFKESAIEYVKGYELEKEVESVVINELHDLVFSGMDGDFDEAQRAYRAIQESNFTFVCFSDFLCDCSVDEYTYHFIWALYAIAWGVIQCDRAKL